jgi:hypothetical protein
MEVVVAYSLRYYPGIFLEGPGKPRKTCQDGPFPGRHLNLEPLEYEAGVLTTQSRR